MIIDPNYKPKSISLSDAVEKALTGSIDSIETLELAQGETLLVGMAKCSRIEAADLGKMLDELMPRFKNRILVYPSDELEFKKVRFK